MPSSNYRRACHECQSRHLKCDIKKPCTQCTQAGRTCKESRRHQFRHDYNPTVASGRKSFQSEQFGSKQKWAKIPKHLVFTCDPGSSLSTTESKDLEAETPAWDDCQLQSPERLVFSHENPQTFPTPSSESDPFSSQPDTVETGSPTTENLSGISEDYHPFEVESILWPLSSRDEGVLMKHFATELAPLFDFCDRERHFATIVVPAAATSPILHNAILAVSAKHLSLTKNLNRYTPHKYQQECLRLLIPALAVQNSFLDDKLFAATVMLRFFHEMTEPLDEPDISAHVLGSHILLSARERVRVNCDNMTASSLRSATLNVELRQEIHIGFLTNRPPPAALIKYCNIDRSLDPANDWTWAWRVFALAADVLAYCNGDNPKTPLAWKELWESLEMWRGNLPPSFAPIFEDPGSSENGSFLPDIWFANECHAAAHQYLSIARILLLAHDPNIPPLGLARNLALEKINTQIKNEVLKICGIACSNRHFTPVLNGAGIVIAMCGDRFTDRREQEVLIEILEKMEVTLSWPRLRAQDRLREFWGWDSGSV